jgi:proteasome lid subunit RPN8/RPN11
MAKQVVDSLLTYSQMAYPKEGILLLRGKFRKGVAEITTVIVPPAATHGEGFSSFNWSMIPIDFSFIGVAHSHPSGNISPSPEDLLHVTGRVMVIIGYPFVDFRYVGVYDTQGRQIPFEVK